MGAKLRALVRRREPVHWWCPCCNVWGCWLIAILIAILATILLVIFTVLAAIMVVILPGLCA